MVNLFKKRKNEKLYVVAEGPFIEWPSIKDDVFSTGMMGDRFPIIFLYNVRRNLSPWFILKLFLFIKAKGNKVRYNKKKE